MNTGFLGPAVATVLTACGIETLNGHIKMKYQIPLVATVLTACGIETEEVRESINKLKASCNSTYRLRY